MTASPLPRPARVAGVLIAVVVGLGLAVSVFALGWIGVRGAIAADHLRSAQDSAGQVVANIGDPTVAAAAIAAVSDDVSAAHALTSDPIWRALETTPWLGAQLVAVATVASAADSVATDALTPLADVAATLSPASFKPTDGRVDVSAFIAMQSAATTAATAMATADDSLDRIPTSALVGPLRDVITQVTDQFAAAQTGTQSLENASRLVPAMLGAEGPRDYLVLFQNNAEWRSLGGINGAMVLIHTDGGALQLATTDAGSAFPGSDTSVVPLSDEVTAIYGQRPGQWMQNVTQVPDFAVSAQLARRQWALKHGTEVDGVLALDPIALSYILAATGPVTLPSGDVLTSENAVALLLNDVYLRYPDTADQDAFFAEATGAIFGALTSGPVDPSGLLTALAKAGDQNRLMIWSAHDEDQELLANTSLAGGLPRTDSEVSTFGVFVNDGTGSKMDFYQSVDAQVLWESCTLDSRDLAQGIADLNVTVANNAPADAANLPDYVTAAGWYGVPPGSTRTVGYIYLPEGFELTNATLSNGSGFSGGMHDGRRVLSFDVVLAPGESVVASVAASPTSPTGATLVAQVTPTVNANVTRPISACL
ncbi:DUF4012 domain-containing protein [uncultured Microbacterium sp.]|uniref:DUF4012 domain-containing protein n=1 Tax=uncultured Microbacterium sp. TaxID=191216 RepID=UPI0028D4CE22|nr:DUF4012 domain-containing protein [uncultured Microbacterium sp.]